MSTRRPPNIGNSTTDTAYYETWEARGKRLHAEREKAKTVNRPVGRPPRHTADVKAAMLHDVLTFGSPTDTAKKFKVARTTVHRVMKAANVPKGSLPKKQPKPHKVTIITHVTAEEFAVVKRVAKQRKRSMSAEVRLAIQRYFSL